jgi:hypothetical protein
MHDRIPGIRSEVCKRESLHERDADQKETFSGPGCGGEKMGQLNLAAWLPVVLLSITSKAPFNRALAILTGLQFIILETQAVSEYAIADKIQRQKSAPVKPEVITGVLARTDPRSFINRPYVSHFATLWTCFLTALVCLVFSAVCAFLPSAAFQSQTAFFPILFLVVVLVLIRFGLSAACNRSSHRRFSYIYGLLAFVLAFITFRKESLGIFEFRFGLLAFIEIDKLFIDILSSLFVGILAMSLSTSLSYEIFTERLRQTVHSSLSPFPFTETFRQSFTKSKQLCSAIVYNLTGVFPIVFFVLMNLLSDKGCDFWFAFGFCLFEVLIAIFRLLQVHLKVQLAYFNALGSVLEFHRKRSLNSGKRAQATVERSFCMIPVSALALSLQPMVVVVAGGGFLVSAAFQGALAEVARGALLFVVGVSDLLLGGFHILGLIASEVE